jgi:hypothetical protein
MWELVEKRWAPRFKAYLPCSVSALVKVTVIEDGKGGQVLSAHTRDISATGLALIVPAITVRHNYLLDINSTLQIVLELPIGETQIRANPRRLQRLEKGSLDSGYLIGVRISQMGESDQTRFESYLCALGWTKDEISRWPLNPIHT